MPEADTCFHCALPNPRGANFSVVFDDVSYAVCCPGCKAVAELIRDSGMSNYYELRDTPDPGAGRPADESEEWKVFNSVEMLHAFSDVDEDMATTSIYAGGMYCSACSWLIENSLAKAPGVASVEVNPITHRVRVRWDTRKNQLGDLLSLLSGLGYQPQPLARDDSSRPEVAEQRIALKRLLVASLGMMQVMMFAVGLYAGEFQGIDDDMQKFLRLVSFLVTTPVVFYAARPFFAGAIRGLKARMPGMDLPVSIAIAAAYIASVYSTLNDGSAVWFDSVTMFVFFLTLGRFLEMRARHRSIDRSVALSQVLPNTATRIEGDQRMTVPVSQLQRDDLLLLRAGDPVPADGIIVNGETTVDESLLSGESDPQLRGPGDKLAAGSVNLDAAVELRVEATGNDTALGAISRLSERARFARPAFVQLADRIASYVVIALLGIAAIVAAYWSFAAPDRAFVITLSVLVVTCPCALALATPAAFAAAGSRLAQLQLLLTNGNAVEAIARATHFVFDKTGTLTTGRPVVSSVTLHSDDYDEASCLTIAAALEQISTHPVARAFPAVEAMPDVQDAQVHVAAGVSGIIDGQHWRIGSADFTGTAEMDSESTVIALTAGDVLIARFELRDEIRSAARETLDALRNEGVSISIVSGDNQRAVDRVAELFDIEDRHGGYSPENKLAYIKALQESGARVIMVGDGINDAPVLSGADASIAPAHGAMLAQTNADIILLGESLQPLTTVFRMSRHTLRIVRQNLLWAIAYNVTALPLAAAGYVPPWAAAIGMSASSLVVVLNALRLNRYT